MLYSIAFIMDPRAKIRGFNKALVLLSNLSGTSYSPYLTKVKAQLSTMFNKYDNNFGVVRMQRPSQPPSSDKKKLVRVRFLVLILLMLVHETLELLLVMVFSLRPSPLSRRTSASALLQAASTSAGLGIGSKLTSSLDSDTVN